MVLGLAVIAGTLIWQRLRPLTLDEKIGQMLMFGFLGSKPQGKWAIRVSEQIAAGQIGSIVFLGHNFKTKTGVKGLTKLFSSTSARYAPLLALDMEGGFVQRLGAKLGYEKIPPAQTIAETMNPHEARAKFLELAKITKSAGFNVNLGPIVDLLISPQNPVVGKWKRSFGTDPQQVASYAQQFIAVHREKGVMTVLKHFPGHGSSLSDSHDGFVDITNSWKPKELQPFQTLIANGYADAIMPGHLILGPKDTKPVSLSKAHIKGVLRDQLKFTGLIISDDLQMSAIVKNYTYEQALVLAINAGVDILMISNTRPPDKELPGKTVAIIRNAVLSGKIAKTRIDSSFQRVLSVKQQLEKGR